MRAGKKFRIEAAGGSLHTLQCGWPLHKVPSPEKGSLNSLNVHSSPRDRPPTEVNRGQIGILGLCHVVLWGGASCEDVIIFENTPFYDMNILFSHLGRLAKEYANAMGFLRPESRRLSHSLYRNRLLGLPEIYAKLSSLWFCRGHGRRRPRNCRRFWTSGCAKMRVCCQLLDVGVRQMRNCRRAGAFFILEVVIALRRRRPRSCCYGRRLWTRRFVKFW